MSNKNYFKMKHISQDTVGAYDMYSTVESCFTYWVFEENLQDLKSTWVFLIISQKNSIKQTWLFLDDRFQDGQASNKNKKVAGHVGHK